MPSFQKPHKGTKYSWIIIPIFLSFSFLQPFFVERAFRIFDRDKNGTVSMSEFIETMHQFAGQSTDEKLVFLFKVYDLDGESRCVMRAIRVLAGHMSHLYGGLVL